MIADSFPTLISTLVTIIGCFTFMLILNVKLTLIVVLMLAVISLATYFLAKGSRKTFSGLQKQVSNINGYAQEMFSGQKVIKVFNHEQQAIAGFKEFNDKLYNYSLRTNAYASVLMPINANLSYITYALVSVLGGKMCIEEPWKLAHWLHFVVCQTVCRSYL